MAGSPKRHHFVPQVYLLAWADERERLAVRRRRSKAPFITGVNNIALENGLYGKGAEAVRRESSFSASEGQWPGLRAEIITTACRARELRERVAAHLTTQRLRTRQQLVQEGFLDSVAAYIETQYVSSATMLSFLKERWGVPSPTEQEIQGACDFFNGAVNMNGGTANFDKPASMDNAEHTERIKEGLLLRHWQVRRAHSPVLITSDAPVVLWSPRTENDHFRGLGLMDADEIWFPIDPRHLLVMSRTSGGRGFADVPARSLEKANVEIAARSFEAVFTSPAQEAQLMKLRMAHNMPAMRFNTAPLYEKAWDGSDLYKGEMIHTWIQPHDEV
jgi:hypothetical protein